MNKAMPLNDLRALIESANSFGHRFADNGAELIGHVPHVAPEAWFHLLFPPLVDAQIDALQAALPVAIPEVFQQFLMMTNGCHLFSDSISIDGLRQDYSRTGDTVWQPYNIITPNTIERPEDAGANELFIGGYNWDGSRLYIDVDTLKVHRCEADSAKPLNTWGGFWAMLVSEVQRMSLLFDSKGRQIDPDLPTTP
jgi:hypothetical protein